MTRPETVEKCEHEKRRADLTGKKVQDDINKYIKVSEDHDMTWRGWINLLSKREVRYVDPVAAKKYENEKGNKKASLKALCLWDVDRGSFHQWNSHDWESQQNDLFNLYNKLCSDRNKLAIVVRTSDPKHFEHFLKKLTEGGDKPPIVILVCALSWLKDGDLRVSGTWSAVWRELYDYLKNKNNYNYLFHSGNGKGNGKPNWKFHIVIPVYQDGVIWIGPDCWPIDDSDRQYLGEDQLPIGRLFMVPGAQPGLSDFEEHGPLIGVITLLTHAILEHLAEKEEKIDAATAEPGELGRANLDRPIRQGLMRIRRLRNRGYGGADELMSLKSAQRPDLFIPFPCEVWKKPERDVTDFLLDVDVTGGADKREFAGPYEVKCKVDPTTGPQRIFHAIEKKIGGEFVASPQNCILVAGDVSSKMNGDLIKDHWIKINGKTYPINSYSELVIKTSWLDGASRCSSTNSQLPIRTKRGRFSIWPSGSSSMPRETVTILREAFSTSRCLVALARASRFWRARSPIDRCETRDFHREGIQYLPVYRSGPADGCV